MDIMGRKTKVELQEMQTRYGEAQAAREALAVEAARLDDGYKALVKVNELLVDDILTLKGTQAKYVGNDYRDYETAVLAIAEKYNGKSDWGCLQTGEVIDLRAAFILGDGVKVIHKTDTKQEAKRELQFAKDFMEYNGLDAEMSQEIAKEAEIEGKVALRLFWETDKFRDWQGMVSVRFISWTAKHYKVEADPDDYLWYKKLTWLAGANYPAGNVPEEEFVYKKFGGRINDPNEAQPKIMKCLTQIDRLDRALRDLREINHLFASPTPDFQVDDPLQAMKLLQFLKDTNWRIGKAIAHVGTFRLVSPDIAGIESLIREVETTTKMISGTTGIPIHYLGLLDLLKNRATGDNTREMVMAATTRERSIWAGAFEEMLDKAIVMYNVKSGTAQKSVEGGKLDPEKIGVEIPLISQDHWANIERVLIPAALGNIISKEFVAGQIPGIDLEDEAAKREEQDQKDAEQAQADLEKIRAGQAQVGAQAGQNQPPRGQGGVN